MLGGRGGVGVGVWLERVVLSPRLLPWGGRRRRGLEVQLEPTLLYTNPSLGLVPYNHHSPPFTPFRTLYLYV